MSPEKTDDAPDHPAISALYVLLGLLVVLTAAYLAFAWFGKTLPDIGWITTLIGGGITYWVKDRYEQREADRRALALKAEQDLAKAQQDADANAKITYRKTVLLIEDNPFQQEMIKRTLWTARAETYIASSVEQALEMLAQTPPYEFLPKPDCILLDLSFSKTPLQGRDFIIHKINDPRLFDIPLIIVTGSDQKDLPEADLQLFETACRYVRKGNPLDIVKAILACTDGSTGEITHKFFIKPEDGK